MTELWDREVDWETVASCYKDMLTDICGTEDLVHCEFCQMPECKVNTEQEKWTHCKMCGNWLCADCKTETKWCSKTCWLRDIED